MSLTRWALLLTVAGVAMLVLSVCWPRVARTGTPWTEEKAKEHAQAAARVHHLAHDRVHAQGPQKGEPPHAHEASSAETLEEARSRFERTSAELQRAKTAGQGVTTVFWWFGIVCVVLGGGGYLWPRLSDAK